MTEAAASPLPQPARLVKSEERQPCGCLVTVMSDDRTIRSPCMPCGLIFAAQEMAAIAARFATVSQILTSAGQRAHADRTSRPIIL